MDGTINEYELCTCMSCGLWAGLGVGGDVGYGWGEGWGWGLGAGVWACRDDSDVTSIDQIHGRAVSHFYINYRAPLLLSRGPVQCFLAF